MTTELSAKRRRRLFSFTLKSFMLLVLVGCLALGWKVEQVRKQRAAVSWVQEMGGSVSYDIDNPNGEPPAPKWLIKYFGVDFFDSVVRVDVPAGMQLNDVSPLSAFTSLKILYLNGTSVNDVTPLSDLTSLECLGLERTGVSDLTPLARMTRLRFLQLGGTQVSELTPLAGLTNLETLYLHQTQVSDVTPLSGLTNLEWLVLDNTHLSEVAALSELIRLKKLSVENTHVSENAVEKLQERIPQCRIVLRR